MTTVHAVLPDGIDNPARPSGGNVYDRRVCNGLASRGWVVREHAVRGFWGRPDASSFAALAGILRSIPDDAVVLLDGLVASAAPDVLAPHAHRLRLVVLVHMPLGHRPPADGAEEVRMHERKALSAAGRVVATSAWCRRRLLQLYQLSADRTHVAEPGVDPAELATGTGGGGSLLCVAAVTLDKGHDVLLDALARNSDLSWHCGCVGPLGRDPAFVESLRRRALDAGLDERVEFPGPRTGVGLEGSYAAADLLVLASRTETYGMVVTEALAHGLPVVAAEVGGVAEALGHAPGGTPPGLLVPPGDAVALGDALRAWLVDAELRRRLRRSARERRESLSPWSTTTSVIAAVLAAAAHD